jgi:hypothetical protein
MPDQIRQVVIDLLNDLPYRKLDSLKQLFWSELNYDRANSELPIRTWQQLAQQTLVHPPLLFATAGDGNGFHIIYCHLQSDHLLLGEERQIIKNLIQDHPFALYLFSDVSQTQWHFVNVKYDKDAGNRNRQVFRRISVGPHERLRTAAERIALLDIVTLTRDLFGIPPIIIQQRHDEAFNVEAITQRFFDGYQKIFVDFKNILKAQTNDEKWAHEYALQFLNRLMFIYYVQRKKWLGGDSEFLANFWNLYNDLKNDYGDDTFVSEWLNILFFEAFNKKFQASRSDRQYFPENIRNILAAAPFLNGGLFYSNQLDELYSVFISDQVFQMVFLFLENYNFTISEDTPLDQEVAVDPEMIGKVYESLVNITDDAEDRSDAGIFYTPRVEIDLMCRLSLVDYLSNHLGKENKLSLYELVFALEDEDKKQIDQILANANLWQSLDPLIRTITVIDPACGSGSFLVGMLFVLDDLRHRANVQLGRQETPYERKMDIVRNNLYGVDVMRWAVHIAELRLWLQLVIDTQMVDPEELQIRPLLPNLSFKIRPGDSLVQEVGGMNLAVRFGKEMSSILKTRLKSLKTEKLKYYNNDPERKYHSEDELKHAELLLFREILNERIQHLENRIEERRTGLMPTNIFGEEVGSQTDSDQLSFQQDIKNLSIDLENTRKAKDFLVNANAIPFVWDIAFVEIFEDEKSGFDIVIGNPPYVRQEKIRDPMQPAVSSEDQNAKKNYKAKLAQSVYMRWPLSFGYDWSKGDAKWKLDAKSDLYIYFYLYGLSLLNSKGSFCFITSNSWLDVGYGKDLQEFLLTRGKVKFIIDNQNRRSFSSADVNTVIALLGAASNSKTENRGSLNHVARFVMLLVPYEQTLSPEIWSDIDSSTQRTKSNEYKVYPLLQKDIFTIGIDPEKNKYSGDKWGGRYLRAPDIFFTIISKGKKLQESLSTFFEGERYLNTGGADGFFIINSDSVNKISDEISVIKNNQVLIPKGKPFEGPIENIFLVPLVKGLTRNQRKIEIDGYDAYCLVVKGPPTPNLSAYIHWGEQQGYQLRSVTRNQHPWYKPTNQMLKGAKILVPRSFNDTFVIHYNPQEILSLRFYRLHLKRGEEKSLLGYLNSTLIAFILETLGNKSLGQGVLDFFMADFLALKVPVISNNDVAQAFDVMSHRKIGNVWEEFGSNQNTDGPTSITLLQDRKDLDDLIFDAIGLTSGEKNAVYEDLLQMVDDRLKKASSLNAKRTAQKLSEMDW